MPLQIPPAVGTSGQFVETVIVTSSQQRHIMVLGDGVSTAYAPVTSSAGSLVNVSNPSTAVNVVNTVTVLSASSGLVQISGTPTVLSASSGLVQISGVPAVTVQGSSGGTVLVTTSGAMSVTISTAGGTGSTGVSVFGFGSVTTATQTQAIVTSSGALLITGVAGVGTSQVNVVGSSNATAPATSSGGLLVTAIPSSNYTVTATSATNPWSSAPGFNIPIVSVSSGLVQISGNITSTATTITSGTITLSSATSLSSGTVTLSSAPSVQQGASLITGTSTGPWIVDLRNQVFSSVPQYAEVSATSSGHVSIVTAVSSMRIYVLGYALIADSSNTMIWESSNTDLSGTMLLSTGGAGLVCPLVAPGQGAWMQTSVNGDLGILVGNAGTIAGHLTYYTASS